ncbi:hypothetical protein [Palleronia marisminoris]|nr:hypothetical protein [Palleronia marisminoris]
MTFTFIKGAMLAGAMIAPHADAGPGTTRSAAPEAPAIVLTVPAQSATH